MVVLLCLSNINIKGPWKMIAPCPSSAPSPAFWWTPSCSSSFSSACFPSLTTQNYPIRPRSLSCSQHPPSWARLNSMTLFSPVLLRYVILLLLLWLCSWWTGSHRRTWWSYRERRRLQICGSEIGTRIGWESSTLTRAVRAQARFHLDRCPLPG